MLVAYRLAVSKRFYPLQSSCKLGNASPFPPRLWRKKRRRRLPPLRNMIHQTSIPAFKINSLLRFYCVL